jgi:hypothetical protein
MDQTNPDDGGGSSSIEIWSRWWQRLDRLLGGRNGARWRRGSTSSRTAWRAVPMVDGEQSRRWTVSSPVGGDETKSWRHDDESWQWRREENEGKTTAQQSGIDRNEDQLKKIGSSATCRSTGEERKNITLIYGSGYHVINNTCIHSRTGGRIYTCIWRRNIQRTPLKKYNNKKANIHLTHWTASYNLVWSIKCWAVLEL